jgi:aconitate decarboxylase
MSASSSGNAYTAGLAHWISGFRFEAIPSEVVARAKLLILDSIGSGIFGSAPPHSRMLLETIASLDRGTECSVWGSRQRLSAPHAALVNGAAIQGFELDDAHPGGVHVGCGALPAAIAIGEVRGGMSGRDFLTAVVAAFEAAPRVGLCVGAGFPGRGWHSGALGVFSGVAAAASALKLDPGQTVHALGIAGTQAAGLMAAQYGAMVKRMHAGRGSQGGLYAAFLAERGYTGIENLFECEYGGFCSTYVGTGCELAELTSELGERFETMRTSLKFYSSAASTHTAIDAVRGLKEKHGFTADDVERIVVDTSKRIVEHVGWKYEPKGLTSAQMNLAFCLATLMLEGDVFIEQFSDDAVTDPRRMAFAERVEVREDPGITALGRKERYRVAVEVLLRDGRSYGCTVDAARGSARQFASEADVCGKFAKLCSKVLPAARVSELQDAVMNLEEVSDIRTLAGLLTLPD